MNHINYINFFANIPISQKETEEGSHFEKSKAYHLALRALAQNKGWLKHPSLIERIVVRLGTIKPPDAESHALVGEIYQKIMASDGIRYKSSQAIPIQ